mmetsp:Transcript_44565/g.111972  ORF Transcript_44565/g.111972 Transcript_44565/m.111972 type:complete len:216 (-) Transcript_44565:1954-2601(-)
MELEAEAHEGPILEGEIGEEGTALAHVADVGDAEDVEVAIDFHLVQLLSLFLFLHLLLSLFLFRLLHAVLLLLAIRLAVHILIRLFTVGGRNAMLLLLSLLFLSPLLLLGSLEFLSLCRGFLLLLPQGSLFDTLLPLVLLQAPLLKLLLPLDPMLVKRVRRHQVLDACCKFFVKHPFLHILSNLGSLRPLVPYFVKALLPRGNGELGEALAERES